MKLLQLLSRCPQRNTVTIPLIPLILLFLTFFGTCFGQRSFQKMRLYVGQSVTLKCLPTNLYIDKNMQFQWEKPLGTVIGRTPTLQISKVDFEDGGTYTCRVTQTINNEIQEKLLSTQLSVNSRDDDGDTGTSFQPPVIRFMETDTNVMEKTKLEFLYVNCQVNNWPTQDFSIRWMKDNRPINGASKSLFIYPLKEEHNGVYSCEVTHRRTQQKFQKFLTVRVRDPNFNIQSLPGEYLAVGGRILRKCQLNSQSSTYSFKWLKDGSNEVSNNELLDIRITGPESYGRYTCVVRNDKGTKFQYNLNIGIGGGGTGTGGGGTGTGGGGTGTGGGGTGTGGGGTGIGGGGTGTGGGGTGTGGGGTGTGGRADNTRVTIYNTPLSPDIAKPFTLLCQINPPQQNARYEWRKNGQLVGQRQELVISKFRKDDTGRYECTVRLPYGDELRSLPIKKIDIKFQISPRNEIKLSDVGTQMISRVGDRREMHCEIDTGSGSQGRDARWFFKGQNLGENELANYNIYRSDRVFVSILVLNNVKVENEGEYRCEVNGKSMKTNLIVMSEEILLNINPKRLEVDEGRQAEFHCQVVNNKGINNKRLEWSFNFKQDRRGSPSRSLNDGRAGKWSINNNPQTPDTSFISLQQTRIDDTGFYTCTLPSGQKQTAELIVRKRAVGRVRVMISPPIVRTRPNQRFVIECTSTSMSNGLPYGQPRFRFSNGRVILTDPRFVSRDITYGKTQLSVPNGLSLRDHGKEIECYIPQTGDSERSVIYIESQCQVNYRRCDNSQCIPAGQFCDGRRDCSDGSDEDPNKCNLNKCEPLVKKCEYYNQQSPLKATYLMHWECDGEDDCGNNFDESRCQAQASQCGGLFYQCLNSRKPIPRSYQCDKEMDCPGNDDETGCTPPRVQQIRTFERLQRVRIGGTVTLQCESYGEPLPKVAWRQNWGCLLDKSRMIVFNRVEGCRKTISTLTITNFKPGDDGIYNCEALSGQSRAFSDDFQLILER